MTQQTTKVTLDGPWAIRKGMVRWLFGFVFTSALAISTLDGCSSTPRREFIPGDCGSFCARIAQCSAKARYPHLHKKLCEIGRCETGDKCIDKIDSPSGRYLGPFQFVASTWNAECVPYFKRSGFSECESPIARYDLCCATMCAAELLATDGKRHWPTCGKRKY